SQRASSRTEPRQKLSWAVEIGKVDEPDVCRTHARPVGRRGPANWNAQRDLVEVRRERIDVPRKRSFRLPQRSVRCLPERHVIDDAELHALRLAACKRSYTEMTEVTYFSTPNRGRTYSRAASPSDRRSALDLNSRLSARPNAAESAGGTSRPV